jgi:hypothetical protein
MNVSAAAVRRWVAMPWRRWVEGTKRRGIPRGVGRGCGWQKREVVGSIGIRERDGVWEVEEGEGVAMAIAVVMRWASTQPTIFSRWDEKLVLVVVVGIGTSMR